MKDKIMLQITPLTIGDKKIIVDNIGALNLPIGGKITISNGMSGNIEIGDEIDSYIYSLKSLNILDDAEKRYLKAVIRPFKHRVSYIIKRYYSSKKSYLEINLPNDNSFLPTFEIETMYQKMEINKKYTLKELGLD